MPDVQTLHDREILEAIKTVSVKGESGMLQMNTGSIAGSFFFLNGLLTDARVGNLMGFQAVNAAASLRDVSFSFDPSVTPPAVSSITQSERVVLKQFFGIDTVAPEESHAFEELIYVEDDAVAPVESPAPEPVIYAGDDEATLVKRRVPIGEVPSDEVPIPLPYQPSSTPLYRSGLAVATVVFLLATAAVVLLYKFGDYSSPALVATSNQGSRAPVTEQVAANNQVARNIPVASGDPVRPNNQVAQNNQVARNIPVAPSNPVRPNIQAEPDKPVEPNDNDASSAGDLSGKWNVVNTISKTSYRSFNNMEIGFDLSIEQHGKGFTGTGQKVSENGRRLPESSRTPIQVKGSINGDVVEATFFEQGTARKTNGRFVWKINKAGGLTGTFNSNAARTIGKSTARKV